MSRSPWKDGLADAVAFVVGALCGFALGQLLGADIFAPGYGIGTIIGIALAGFGGGAGLQLARLWRGRQA
ncbi:MAG: hypothetical protein ABI650_05180 [Dokdonella sp.]